MTIPEQIAEYLIHNHWEILKDLNSMNLKRIETIKNKPEFKDEINEQYITAAKEIIAIKIGNSKAINPLNIYEELDNVNIKIYLELE